MRTKYGYRYGYLGSRAAGGGGGFTPATLFAASEQGVWYDPSDFSTMYQDSAGTIPVTAVGQPVGFLGDKSKGFALGPELVSNPSNSLVLTPSNVVEVDTGADVVAGVTYKIQFSVLSDTSTGYQLRFRSTGGGADFTIPLYTSASSPGIYSAIHRFGFSGNLNLRHFTDATGSGEISFDNISVRELPGNHAVQPTAASRPVLGRVPFGGRRNLLTYTEQFDNAAWGKQAATVTADNTTSPIGTATADRLADNNAGGTGSVWVTQNVTVSTSTVHTYSVYAKVDGLSWLSLDLINFTTPGNISNFFDVGSGVVGTVGVGVTTAITSVGNGWYRCSVTFTTHSSDTLGTVRVRLATADNNLTVDLDGTSSLFIWGAQLETGSTATDYQKVVTALDVTEAGVADNYYLQFDGVDDFLSTANIDFSATDEMTVVAGVRKLSDASAGHVVELSGSVSANNGAFYMAAPNSPNTSNYIYTTKGSATLNFGISPNSYAAPRLDVLTGLSSILGDSVILRVNGAQIAADIDDNGVGNFGTYPLFIGRRGGISNAFNGHLFGLVIRGKTTAGADLTNVETFVAGKTGVTIP